VEKGHVDLGHDAALVRRFQAGEEAAFDELFRHYFDRLKGYCRRRLGDDQEAEEVAQEAFVRAFVALPRLNGERRFFPWICVIARHLCANAIAARARVQPGEANDAAYYDDRLDALVEGVDRALLRSVIAKLSGRHRQALELWADGTSSADIAARLGCTPGTADVIVHRARQRLRERYLVLSGEHSRWALIPGVPALRRVVDRIRWRMASAITQNPELVSFPTAKAIAIVAAISLASGSTVGGGALAAARGGVQSTGISTAGRGVDDPRSRLPQPSASGGGSSHDAAHEVASSRTPAPAQGREPRPITDSGVVGPIGGSDNPDDAAILSFSASPQYARDHEVYASGQVKPCSGGCPTLFHSTDGGATWTRIRSRASDRGPVLFPPAYPTDKRIFVAGGQALYESSDSGVTLTPVAPVGGFAAMSPGFSAGDPKILIGSTPGGWVYHDDSKQTTPFETMPQSNADPLTFAFAPSYPRDDRVLVGGTEGIGFYTGTATDASTAANSVVYLCHRSSCGPAVVLADGTGGTPQVMTSHRYGATGLAYAWTGDRLYRTVDGGASFTRLALPAKGYVQGVVEDGAGRIYLGLLDNGEDGTTGGVYSSQDAGATWKHLGAGTSLDYGVWTIAVLPDGKLLVGPTGGRPMGYVGGVLCSSDGGATWARRCS
jgi:RNA polymerase sigma-70 factor (ECF subfamily)